MSNVTLSAGLVVGFSIAAPIGPMGLLCIQRTLASGMGVGVCTGLGAATVNVAYGALVILGLDRIAPWMAGGGRALGAAGGVFLLWSAVRTLRRRIPVQPSGPARLSDPPGRPAPGQLNEPARSPLAAFGSALAFNATNPLSPLLIMALLSPLVGLSAPPPDAAAALLLGMFAGATAWWVCLSGGVSLLRSRLSPAALGHVNRAAGLVLTLYGALALARSAGM